METDATENPGEGHLFSDYSHCLGEFTFSVEAHIAWYIYPRRAGVAARDKSSFAFRPLDIEVEQGSGGGLAALSEP